MAARMGKMKVCRKNRFKCECNYHKAYNAGFTKGHAVGYEKGRSEGWGQGWANAGGRK